MSDLKQTLQAIIDLPRDWHGAGTVSEPVLHAMVRHTQGMELSHSAETGTGKTSLLLSHLSPDHCIFANRDDSGSLEAVASSPLFAAHRARFIEGPTQLTLPGFRFEHPLQLVLLDGPHGFPFVEMEYWHFYPQIEAGGLLIVDDIHIATVHNLYCFIREDEMFEELERVGSTAFFRRSDAPLFHPHGDGWWLQGYNKARHPMHLKGICEAGDSGLDARINCLRAHVATLRDRLEDGNGDGETMSADQAARLAALARELLTLSGGRDN